MILVPAEVNQERTIVDKPTNSDSPVTAIAKLIAGGASTEAIQQLKSLVEWDDARRARSAFNTAFALAKPKFKQAKRSGINQRLNARYSLLTDLDDATRDALGEHGFAWRHTTHYLDGGILSVRCILSHKDGHSEEAEQRAKEQAGKTGGAGNNNSAVNELQAGGITETYLKRRTLADVTGIVSDMGIETDTDGENNYVPRITDEQAAELEKELSDTKADRQKFLEWLSKSGKIDIKSISDLPANMFGMARNALIGHKRKQQKDKQKDENK